MRTVLRFDHVGVVVDDLEAAAVDKINGLDGVRAEVMMVRTPDRTGRLELVRYRLVCVRGPEGLIVELAEAIGG